MDSVDDTRPVPIYWRPLPDSGGRPYLLIVTQRDASGRVLRPAPFMVGTDPGEGGLIYSPPLAQSSYPEALLFSPVTQCNLNCIHCLSAFTRTQFDECRDSDWSELRSSAADGRLRALRSDYSGDLFFSDRRAARWLERVLALDIPFAIDTHANDLDDSIVERLMKSRLYSINFSIDSMDAEDYAHVRRGAQPLSDVLTNIRRFMAAKNRTRPDIETILSFTLMRRTLDTLADAIGVASELGISAVCGNHLHAWDLALAEESLMLDPERYRAAFASIRERALAAGVRLGLPLPTVPAAPRRTHRPCRYPWTSAVVLGNGDVMACCVPGTRVGNIRESSLGDIWNGAAMRAFRESVNSDRPPAACRDCPMVRLENNFASYVRGLTEPQKQSFASRCHALSKQVPQSHG